MTTESVAPAYAAETFEYPAWEPGPPVVTAEKKPNRVAKVALVTLASWAAAATLVAVGAYGSRVLTPAPAAPAPVVVTETVPLPTNPRAEFLADLNRAGIPVSEPDVVVHNGYVVIVALGTGMTEDEVVNSIIDNSAKTGIPRAKAASFVHLAIVHFGPALRS